MPHMTPQEFERAGDAFLRWAADWQRRVERSGSAHAGEPREAMPVSARVAPGDTARLLPDHPPDAPDADWRAWLADLDRIIAPGVLQWQSPRFYGFFPCNTTGPAILADLVASTLNAQAMMWMTSPAATELETRMLDWLRELLGLPERFDSRAPGANGAPGYGGGVIQGAASEACLVCMIAARDRARRLNPGLSIDRMTVYASSQAHSSIQKSAMVAGFLPDHFRLIGVDAALRIRADALDDAIRADRARGLTPVFICATIGTTGAGAIDPVPAIGAIAQRERLWLHVDAAWAGAAAVCPEFRPLLAGVDLADSFNFNPHKWLLTTFDCSALFVADRRPLIDALSITPEYLRNRASDSGAVIDYRDWGVPLGRRFRALKLWFVLRHYGAEGLREHIRLGVRLAHTLESLVRADERFELGAERSLALLCVRLRDADSARADARTRALHERLNATGRTHLTLTTLPRPAPDGAPCAAIRIAIGAVGTREEHIRELWELLRAEAGRV